MRNLFPLSIVFCFLLMTTVVRSQSADPLSPADYNNFVVDQQNAIGAELKVFISVITDPASEQSEAMDELTTLSGVIDQSVKRLELLKPIDPDFDLKSSALSLFGFYKRTMTTTYVEVVNELYAEVPDADKLNQYLATITEEEAVYDNAFQSAQSAFADHYNITLEENDLMKE
jgi:hypothetical protein